MARKKTKSKCLVLYPASLQQNYSDIYSPAIQELNLEPITLSKILTTASRISKVQEIMEEAVFIVADVSERDKDVLFRAGLAEALGKPVGIIAQSIGDIPSDLQHVGYAVYEVRNPNWAADLRKDIQDLVRGILGI